MSSINKSTNFHQHLMQNGDFRYFAQKIDKPSILVHSKCHRSIQHPRKKKTQTRNFHQHLMQNDDFRYFAHKIDKSCKNLKMLNDRNDLLFKPVLTRWNFNTLSLTNKKFFLVGGGVVLVVVVVVIWRKTLKFVYGEAASAVGGLK